MRSFLFTAVALSVALVNATTITSDSVVAKDQTFDYIIAGAGLCGSVVGSKLADAGYKVLLIEAGKDARNLESVNVARLQNQIPAEFNWNYDMENEPQAALAGKCVGGGTCINGGAWWFPSRPHEFDTLAAASGDAGWSHASMIPYMKAAENVTRPNAAQKAQGATLVESVHGFNGAINVSFPAADRVPEHVPLYRKAFQAVFTPPAFSSTKDLSDRTSTGAANAMVAVWNDPVTGEDMRSTAAHGFIYNKEYKTMTVLTQHVVGNVIMTKSKATGVTFYSGTSKTPLTAKATKEVILSAGALASPAILQRSGIGAPQDLKAAGIPLKINLPGVGKNLFDHTGSSISALLTQEAADSGKYVNFAAPFAPFVALVDTKQLFPSDWAKRLDDLKANLKAEIKAAVAAGAFVNQSSAKYVYEYVVSLVVDKQMPIAELVGTSYPAVLTAFAWPLMTFSRGYVQAVSTDAFQQAKIVPRLYSHSFDAAVSVQAAKRLRELYKNAAFADIVADPSASPSGNLTDAEWLEYYKTTSTQGAHYGGTTSILPLAKGGVLDSKLKVFKTTGLRVVDGGIIPFAFSTHAMGYLYPLALRAAEVILDDA